MHWESWPSRPKCHLSYSLNSLNPFLVFFMEYFSGYQVVTRNLDYSSFYALPSPQYLQFNQEKPRTKGNAELPIFTAYQSLFCDFGSWREGVVI